MNLFRSWRFWLAVLLVLSFMLLACDTGKVCSANTLCVNSRGEYKSVTKQGRSCPSCPSGYHRVECVVSCMGTSE